MIKLDYYQTAKEASLEIDDHPGLIYLKKLCLTSKKILDLGCGEGTRLNTLLPKGKSGFGIDINLKAINLAKKQYPHHFFKTYQGNILPFKPNIFDLVYSAFVIEHVKNPENFLDQALKVLKPQGHLVILAPNYGAPNRRSPNSTKNPFKKLYLGLKNDFLPFKTRSLNWTKVNPKKTYQQIDDDTTVEPYLLSLIKYLKQKNLKIIKASSVWSKESFSLNPRKLLIAILGKLNIFPFKYWGPQIFISVIK